MGLFENSKIVSVESKRRRQNLIPQRIKMPEKTRNKLLVTNSLTLKSPIIGLLFLRSSVIAAKCLSNVRTEMLI